MTQPPTTTPAPRARWPPTEAIPIHRCACGGSCPRCEEGAFAIQPKLKISQPGDPLEREADRVSEEVMRSPPRPSTAISHVGPGVQKACAECSSGHGPCPECLAEEEKELAQRKAILLRDATILSAPAGGEAVPAEGRGRPGRSRAKRKREDERAAFGRR